MSAVLTTNYVVVKGSVYSGDCTVFGLDKPDEEKVLCQYPSSGDVMNGKIVKAQAVVVINLLARIGYKVVSSTGEADTVWTLEARRTTPQGQQQQQQQQPQHLTPAQHTSPTQQTHH